MRNNVILAVSITTVCITIIAVLAYCLFSLLLSESVYAKKGSFLYYATFPPGIVRNFPLVEVRGDVAYHYSVGDGPKPQSFTLSYSSRMNVSDLHLLAQGYLVEHGFGLSRHQDSTPVVTYERSANSDYADLWVGVAKTSTGAEVSFTYYPN